MVGASEAGFARSQLLSTLDSGISRVMKGRVALKGGGGPAAFSVYGHRPLLIFIYLRDFPAVVQRLVVN
jgi:hypothetical protein